jgi:hypothetical protein
MGPLVALIPEFEKIKVAVGAGMRADLEWEDLDGGLLFGGQLKDPI